MINKLNKTLGITRTERVIEYSRPYGLKRRGLRNELRLLTKERSMITDPVKTDCVFNASKKIN